MDYFDIKAVSASMIKAGRRSLIEAKQLFDRGRIGSSSAAKDLGTMIHRYLLEPSSYALSVGPVNPRTGEVYGRDTKAWRSWEQDNPDAVVLPLGIIHALKNIPFVVHEILVGDTEFCIEASDDGMPVKAKTDVINFSDRFITDLKTIECIHDCRKHIHRYEYWIQDAFYSRVCRLKYGFTPKFRFAFFETSEPYRWKIIELDAGFKMTAESLVRKQMDRFRSAFESGNWDDHDVFEIVECPYQLEQEDDDGE